jgi:SPP1 gp7 family putative phage head morphogenesis protein
MSEFLFQATPHKDAQRFIAGKAAVSRAVFDNLLPDFRPHAFTVTGLENVTVLKKLRDRVADLPAGGDWEDIKKDLVKDLAPHLDDSESGTARSERRAELLLRTHGFQAYSAAETQVLERQVDVFPNWQYATAEDDKVRDSHAALDGKIIPAKSPFWITHTPPWEFGCRCRRIPMSQDDTDEIETADAKKPLEARRVMDGDRLKQLESNKLVAAGDGGMPLFIDVTPPREKFGGSGYSFNARALTMSLDDIKGRYDEATWSVFEGWAQETKIGDGRGTVFEWLEKKLPSATPTDGWPDLAKLKDVRALGGTTGAKLVQSPDGAQYVRKQGNSAAHLREEFAADQLYRALGVPTPASKLYESGKSPVKLSAFLQGKTLAQALREAAPAERAALLAEARKHFVADALLANYDAAGAELDNMLVDRDGKIWRIDNGGSLRFRAQGASKQNFGGKVTELETMRDPKINPAAAQVFGGITDAELRDQMRDVLGRRAAVLAAAPDDLKETLTKRFEDLQARLEKLTPATKDFTPEFAKQVAGARILGKAHLGDEDKVEDLHVLWFTEKRGKQDFTIARFKLTPAGGAAISGAHPELAKSLPPADPFWNRLLPVIKHVGHHAGDGVYNPQKLAILDELKTQLAKQPAGLREHYQGVIDELLGAVKEKRAPKILAQYQPPAPKKSEGKGDLILAPSPWAFVSKERRRGFAETRETQLLQVNSAFGGRHGGTGAEIRAVLPEDSSAPFALRGVVEIAVPGRGGLEALQAVAKTAADLGVAIEPASGARRELTYITRNLSLLHKQLSAEQRTAWSAIAADGTVGEAERATKLRGWMKESLKVDVGDGRAFAPDGAENAFGYGWKRWDRWDLPRGQVEKEMKGYTLHHRLSGAMPDVIESWLDGGGQVTPTVERLRVGQAITSGMSPSADLETGGASYFFTRIKTSATAQKHPGVTFKIGNLARQDAVSYPSDFFGDVRPAGMNTHTSDPRTARGISPEEWKSFSKNSSNETIFKNGFHLLEDVDTINASSAAEREKVIGVFKKHGYEKLPDGRAIDEVVRNISK